MLTIYVFVLFSCSFESIEREGLNIVKETLKQQIPLGGKFIKFLDEDANYMEFSFRGRCYLAHSATHSTEIIEVECEKPKNNQ